MAYCEYSCCWVYHIVVFIVYVSCSLLVIADSITVDSDDEDPKEDLFKPTKTLKPSGEKKTAAKKPAAAKKPRAPAKKKAEKKGETHEEVCFPLRWSLIQLRI